jgi:hypothetical protein
MFDIIYSKELICGVILKNNNKKITRMRLLQSIALKGHIKELYIIKELGLERPASPIYALCSSLVHRCCICNVPLIHYTQHQMITNENQRNLFLIQKCYYNVDWDEYTCEECFPMNHIEFETYTFINKINN